MKRYNIILDRDEIIYNNENITYEELCKVIKKGSKVKFIILAEYILVKIVDFCKREKIEKYIEDMNLEEGDKYLLDYRVNKKENKTYIYGIKIERVGLDIINFYKNIKIVPIQMILKNKGSFNIEIIYNKKSFFAYGRDEFYLGFSKLEREFIRKKIRIYEKGIEVI